MPTHIFAAREREREREKVSFNFLIRGDREGKKKGENVYTKANVLGIVTE